jgi:FADH2 O2-dependent halogenase
MSDVIIIGGGPAGSALGCYLSMAGISNTIIEKENHPRPHVGESMVPVTTRVFREIGFLETMEKEGFPKKYGASWHAPLNKGQVYILFGEFPNDLTNQDYTYHVDRSRMDMLLLKRAEELGSKVYQGMAVKQVLMTDGYASGVRVGVGDKEVDMHCKIVVDASGRNTLLGRQLKLKVKDPIFNQYAVHAWFEGVNRGTDHTAGHIHIYFLPIERGWVWQIPITETVTSMGVVVEKAAFTKMIKGDVEEFFWDQVQTNDNLAAAMKDARRINEFKNEGDYSYKMSKFVGDGYMLIGDAARFVDPIFSSGVSVAMHGARNASIQIKKALEANDFSEEMLMPFETTMRAGVDIWYEFIRLYYKLLPLFTLFMQSKQYRQQVHRLLQGEVYDKNEVPVLEAMRKYIEAVERTEGHLLRDQLTDVPIDLTPEEIFYQMVPEMNAEIAGD